MKQVLRHMLRVEIFIKWHPFLLTVARCLIRHTQQKQNCIAQGCCETKLAMLKDGVGGWRHRYKISLKRTFRVKLQ